jgi:hypothetical protein
MVEGHASPDTATETHPTVRGTNGRSTDPPNVGTAGESVLGRFIYVAMDILKYDSF